MRRSAWSSRRLRVALALVAACVALVVAIGPVAGAAVAAVALLLALGVGMGRGRSMGSANRKTEVLRGQVSRGPRFDPSESAVYDEDAWARVRAEREAEQPDVT